MGRALSRVAGVVFAGALATFAATPAALAQTDPTTAPSSTETSTSETTTTTTTTSEAPASETTTPSTPVTTTGTSTPAPAPQNRDLKTTDSPESTTTAADDSEPPKDDYVDAVGHGFVGLGGEGVLVVACASGKVGDVYTQNLSVTAGPDQDESDGRYWNYTVSVVTPPTEATGRFAFFCDGVEHIGLIDFEQEQPPTSSSSTPTSTSAASSTAPLTTATSAPAGNNAPKAQVKVAPRGGVETGFGGTAG
ncbi:MAG TPA: hypothetical protein VGL47_17480 [Amycolatopsis sp.]|uniref:Secreted protein n=1 Tax=Amycolatopsis nalaikhensis TaxID=715472 RepID=A0ABY8XUY7_9PSEU|nr:hypothetical protein [Amycolatopsis sp. 2-2]WIV59514.1 hypothetical protein QP939_13310 [Amycolatopsis sp. 2-2]